MTISIITYEHIDCTGKTISVNATTKIEVGIGENWSIPALEKSKDKMDDLLARELPGCILTKGGPA